MADEALQGAQAYNARVEGYNANLLARRKTDAYNALAKIYGPIAGDPEAAASLQTTEFQKQREPLVQEGLQLGNTGADLTNKTSQQTLDYNDQANPLALKSKQLSNDTAQQNLDQGAASFPLEQQARQQAVDANGIAVNSSRAAQDRQASFSILSALTETAQQGGDVGAAFDQYAPIIAKMEGTDAAHLGPLREALVRDPVATINALNSALTAQNVVTPGKATAAIKNPAEANTAKANALRVIHERTKAVPQATQQALALIPKFSLSAVMRKASENIPGTPEYQFVQLAKQIGSNLSLDDLRAVRESGLSLGRTNLAEFQASAHAFANLDLGQDPAMLAGALKRLSGSYGQINSNIESDIKRLETGGQGAKITGPAAPQGAGPNDAALDAFIAKYPNIDAAIAATPNDAMALAVADRYERKRGTKPSGSGPAKVDSSKLSDDDLKKKYGL